MRLLLFVVNAFCHSVGFLSGTKVASVMLSGGEGGGSDCVGRLLAERFLATLHLLEPHVLVRALSRPLSLLSLCLAVVQYAVVCCSVLQCVAVCCSVLECVVVLCSVMQYAVVCCSVLQCVAVCCSVLQCVAVCCSVLQCVAVRCGVLQCVAVCCSVL